MLEATSDQGTFSIEIDWTPADIGSKNTFEMHFIEPETGKEVENVVYDFGIEQDDSTILTREDQNSNTQKVVFDEAGPYTLTVRNIEGLGEDASFSVQVVPEFQLVWVLPGAFAALFAVRRLAI